MDNELFRKSSMDQLNSPEQLNEYIRVARPGVWMLLSAIILLLLGVLAWGLFGIVETKVNCGALVENGRAVCYIGEADAQKVKPGDAVTIADMHGTVKRVSASPAVADGENAYLLSLSGLAEGEPCYQVGVEMAGLAAGVYPAEITVESLRPISFVIR